MGDVNPICTLGYYSKPSHKGYRNTNELPVGNNMVHLRSETIRLVQNECSFHELWYEHPNQHLKDFLKLMESLDLETISKRARSTRGQSSSSQDVSTEEKNAFGSYHERSWRKMMKVIRQLGDAGHEGLRFHRHVPQHEPRMNEPSGCMILLSANSNTCPLVTTWTPPPDRPVPRNEHHISSSGADGYDSADVMMAISVDELLDWIIDSEGSYHITYMRDYLVDFEEYDDGKILLGDGRECRIRGTCKVQVQMKDGPCFMLDNDMYVSEVRQNLISLGTLKKEGFTVKMQLAKIKVTKGSLMVLSGTRSANCVYTLDGQAVTRKTMKGRKQLGEYLTEWKIKKCNVLDSCNQRKQHLAWELFSYREDSNEDTFAVAAVDKIYAHESFTFNSTFACEVISKWNAGLKDDTDARSDVYMHSKHYEPTQGILNETARGIFFYKSPNQAFQFLEDKSLKEEMHEMRKNYNNSGGDHASKNDYTPMCERQEVNFIQFGVYQNQNSNDSYFHQSHHGPNDSEKSLTGLNNDLRNDLEHFKRCSLEDIPRHYVIFDMERLDMCLLNWATIGLLDKAKGSVLGTKIIRDQSGNTLRVSQSRFYKKKLVQTLLEGYSILSLEGSLSGTVMWKKIVSGHVYMRLEDRSIRWSVRDLT
uniref:Zinc finger, CCHC-type n=1 Tax=Tanacetum cinerariifolium TaxID=118510 RepID=A0A6L2K9I6_TANCI|nr:zinc finger, CCHC-type [Tanacetum cinerariifolium]